MGIPAWPREHHSAAGSLPQGATVGEHRLGLWPRSQSGAAKVSVRCGAACL